VFSELKPALRTVFRSPRYSLSVALILALGIGANSLVFSRSIGDYSIARRQEGMRFAEHDLIASSSLRFRSEKIRYPRGADLPDEEQAIANQKPVGIRSSKVATG
jgi:hypothetical protein